MQWPFVLIPALRFQAVYPCRPSCFSSIPLSYILVRISFHGLAYHDLQRRALYQHKINTMFLHTMICTPKTCSVAATSKWEAAAHIDQHTHIYHGIHILVHTHANIHRIYLPLQILDLCFTSHRGKRMPATRHLIGSRRSTSCGCNPGNQLPRKTHKLNMAWAKTQDRRDSDSGTWYLTQRAAAHGLELH